MIEVTVPDLGESVTEATVAQWLRAVGEPVTADEPLLELETDKATLEVVAPKDGVLTEILVPEGEDVEVGALLARIDPTATASAAPQETPPAPAPAPVPSAAATPEASTAPAAGDPQISLPDLLSFMGSGANEALERSGPAVRKAVAEAGIDPGTIVATGPDGRIRLEDVAEAQVLASSPAASASAPAAAAEVPREERVKMSRMRRTIATRLKEAQNTAAILTTFNEVDMTRVMALRKRYRDAFEEKHGVKLGFTGFFAKAVVAALQEIPAVNAEIEGEEIIYKHHYDLGMAVSTPTGLVVPVIRDCDQKSLAEIEDSLGELAGAARDGKLSADQMTGGTFSITNGGVFGSLLSTPILNRPQSAILGLHKIQPRPVAVDGEVVVRPMMYLALSYDHRIIDGREAVTFLVKVKEAIEDPERLLLAV
ncbi:MAG: 2-oxoglutarate dehydrogenase complex dihydrolipoyllysine-residue succinyltransferase [Myxococcota bacterium]